MTDVISKVRLNYGVLSQIVNHELFSLEGKTAVVTGGSRGLGLAIARGLSQAGARVVIVARNAPENAEFDFTFARADLQNPQEREDLIQRIAPEIEILFHCAGQQHREASLDFSHDAWREILELHLTAVLDLSQQAARLMMARGGKIILLSSIIGFQGGLMVPAYSAAKHGVNGLVQSLANEWAQHGISVNALAPGYINDGIGRAVLDDPIRGPQILARIPAGRAGEADELAGAAIFLASAASNYVHGQTLVVDGGWLGR